MLLWIAQVLLAVFYGLLGGAKVFAPLDEVALWIPWTIEHPLLTRLTGLVDLVGAIGIIAPDLTGFLPKLGFWAAVGLTVLQLFAVAFHLVRHEPSYLPANVVALALSVFVLWARPTTWTV